MLRFMEKDVYMVGWKNKSCDVDYKSKLSVGNVMNKKIDYLDSDFTTILEKHLDNKNN